MKQNLWRLVGLVGTVVCLVFFFTHPSWPTPDKILVFLTFVFMMFSQAQEMLKRFVPFVALLFIYESFRSFVPELNKHVNYLWMPSVDKFLFGGTLPTVTLQQWWWHGTAQWWDFMFYLAYMLHFILPFVLAIFIWKLREKAYWRYVATFFVVSLAGFITFLLFPAAPPWLASDNGLITHITRVSSGVYSALGVQNYPSLYNKLSPNPVAAVPSLHAAYAMLIFIFTYKLFGKRWALLTAIYPLLIFVGTVYMGEHYAIDEILGIAYAVAGYALVAWLFANQKLQHWLRNYWREQSALW